jgi:hypothetical protein
MSSYTAGGMRTAGCMRTAGGTRTAVWKAQL